MRHHYLPQFYLKGFTDPDVRTGEEPYVWIYYRNEHVWRRRAPRNVAAQSGYYSFKDDKGEESQEAEECLAQIESMSARVLTQKVLSRQPLDAEDRGVLATFVAVMMTRVPAMHEHIGRFESEVARQRLEIMHQMYSEDPRKFQAFKERFRGETGRSDLNDLRPEHLDPANWEIRVTGPHQIGAALSIVTECAEIIREMGWTFLVSRPPDWFITSDNPYCMLDPVNEPGFFGSGLVCRDIEVTIPLSGNVAFFSGWNSRGTRWLDVPRHLVEQVNMRTRSCASRFLIARKPTFPGSDKLPSETSNDYVGKE